MKQYIRQLLFLSLLLLSAAAGAQEIVGPGGPDSPSTGDKTITVTQSPGGTITPAGDWVVTVVGGTSPVFTIRAKEGHVLASVSVDGVPLVIGKDLASYTYTFTAIAENHTLTASFASTRFTLTAEAGNGGSITPTSALVAKGGSQTFTIHPDAGYEIEDVKVDGVSVGVVSSYTCTDVAKDSRIVVSFKSLAYTVSLEEMQNGSLKITDGEGKTVADGDKVPYGTLLTLLPQPAEGFALEELTENGKMLVGTVFAVKEDVAFGAVFSKAVYTVTIEIPVVKGGALTVKNGQTVLLSGTHRIEYGTVLTLENRPETGYDFSGYEVAPGNLLNSDKVTVTGNVTIGAVFAPKIYPVTVTAPVSTEGSLSVMNGQEAIVGEIQLPYGTQLALSNKPAVGKTFAAYTVEPASALTGNIVTVTTGTTIGARFKEAGKDEEDIGSDGEKSYKVTYSAPLVVRKDESVVGNGEMVKENTLLTLVAANTNTQKVVSLSANGNSVEFLTDGGLNTAFYKVTGAVAFTVSLADNRFPVRIETPDGGILAASAGGQPVISGNSYLYGTAVRVTATAAEGYKLVRIMAGNRDITLSQQVILTEDLVLSATFVRQGDIGADPDPENPDPDAPAGIDLTPQQVVYDGRVQSFRLVTMPGGIVDKVQVTYFQNAKKVQPIAAGLYDVQLTRPADDRFAAFDRTIPGGLEIQRAPVTIASVDYTQEQQLGSLVRTLATLEGGKAEYKGKVVAGTFAWTDPSATAGKLAVTVSGYQGVRFTPADPDNYREATAQVHIQVGAAPAPAYRITALTEGEGTVAFYNGDLACEPAEPFYEGMSLSLRAVPASGFRFEGFRVDGVLYDLNPYNLTVTKDQTVTACFQQKADPATPSAVTVTLTPLASLTYDGRAKLVGVSSVPALNGWQVEYRNEKDEAVIPVDAGTYRVLVSREEDEEWLAFEKTSTFTVSKAVPVVTELPVAGGLPAGAPLADSELTGGMAAVAGLGMIPGVFEWDDPEMIMEAEKERTVRFVPSDKVNLFTVTTQVTVPLIDPPAPVCITYTQPSGGTLTVTCEADGKPLPSGTLVVAGTEIRIQAVAVDYFALESLCIGTADFTADAINGNGTVVHAMYSSREISASFIRTSYPPDPDIPDNPDDPDNPDNPDTPDTPDNPDTPDVPEVPDYPDHTIWVRTTGLGSVSPETGKVSHGSDLSFEFTPGYGQQLVDVRLNGNSVGAVSRYSLKNIKEDATIEAVFSNIGIPVYTLTSRTVGKGGFVTPACVRVAEGSNHQFIVHTEAKGALESVQVGTGGTLKAIGKPSSYIFRNVKADSVLVATFGIATATETIVADSPGKICTVSNSLHVYPASSSSILTVYSISGQLIRQESLSGNTVIRTLPSGLYIAELKDGNLLVRQKIWIGK